MRQCRKAHFESLYMVRSELDNNDVVKQQKTCEFNNFKANSS